MRAVPAAGVVVMDVETGRLLAMASKPGLRPERDVRAPDARGGAAAARPIATSRCTTRPWAETYYPGSTFKAVSAIAALEDRLITPEEKAKCHGSFELARHTFKCTKTHLSVNLHDAIVQSCNVYFYELGARPGHDGSAGQVRRRPRARRADRPRPQRRGGGASCRPRSGTANRSARTRRPRASRSGRRSTPSSARGRRA